VTSRNRKRGAPDWRRSFGTRAARGFVPFQTQSRQIKGNSVTYLGKRFRWFGNKRRPLPEVVKGGAFVEDSLGRWWVCFHVEVPETVSLAVNSIGIDLGLKTLATLSTGETVPALQHYRKYERKLATAQRARNKHRVKVVHTKITNARKDQHHKITSKLISQNKFIAIGDVSSTKLAKTRLAKSVFDAGWGQFKSMLLYKARMQGVEVVITNEAFSTQLCSKCQNLGGPKGIAQLGIRSWVCSHCNTTHARDVNAARNILNFAQSALRPVEESRRVA